MTENEISKIIFEAGLYERVYQECLFYELTKAGLKVERQKKLPIKYEELLIQNAFRVDLLVEEKVIVELKSATEKSNAILETQLLNYLRLGKYKLGMQLNFNHLFFKDGVKRIVNGL